MNPRLDLFLSSAATHSRTLYLKGGRRVAVIDRTRRMKSAARALRAKGYRDLAVCCALRRRRDTIERVLAFGWRF